MAKAIIWAAVFLAACSQATPGVEDVPSVEHVNRLEATLAGNQCTGPVDQWERHYFFPLDGPKEPPGWGLNRTTIAFVFRQAGVHDFKRGRSIGTITDALSGPDDRQFKYASGRYDVVTGRLTVDFCGWNCPADVPIGDGCA